MSGAYGLTNNEAALIYCIIGRQDTGKYPTVEESLAIFNPTQKKKKVENVQEAESIDDALDMLNEQQLTLF